MTVLSPNDNTWLDSVKWSRWKCYLNGLSFCFSQLYLWLSKGFQIKMNKLVCFQCVILLYVLSHNYVIRGLWFSLKNPKNKLLTFYTVLSKMYVFNSSFPKCIAICNENVGVVHSLKANSLLLCIFIWEFVSPQTVEMFWLVYFLHLYLQIF